MMRSSLLHRFNGFRHTLLLKIPSGIPTFRFLISTSLHQDHFKSRARPEREERRDDGPSRGKIGDTISKSEKVKMVITTLMDADDSKEGVYGVLDAWVAWEEKFPISSLKFILARLEKEQQWHRVVQVIKWALSKGQGMTMGTYGQLVWALDMDQRAEEAHKIWMKRVTPQMNSAPWQICNLMMSIYFRNNMPDRLVKLFREIEAFNRKPPEWSIVQKVADAYVLLGRPEDKERVMAKYKNIFDDTWKQKQKEKFKSRKKTRNRIDHFRLKAKKDENEEKEENVSVKAKEDGEAVAVRREGVIRVKAKEDGEAVAVRREGVIRVESVESRPTDMGWIQQVLHEKD